MIITSDRRDCHHYRVFVNGEDVSHIVYHADDENGIAYAFVQKGGQNTREFEQDEAGEFRDFKRVCLRGEVKIVREVK